MTTPEIGTFGLIAFDTALPFDVSSIPIEIILPESLVETAEIIETNGMGWWSSWVLRWRLLGRQRLPLQQYLQWILRPRRLQRGVLPRTL